MTRSSSREGELFKQRVAQSAAVSTHRWPLLSGAGRAAEGKKQAAETGRGGLCGVGAVPAEGRVCSLSQEREELGEEGEEHLWAGQVHGAEDSGSGPHVV